MMCDDAVTFELFDVKSSMNTETSQVSPRFTHFVDTFNGLKTMKSISEHPDVTSMALQRAASCSPIRTAQRIN